MKTLTRSSNNKSLRRIVRHTAKQQECIDLINEAHELLAESSLDLIEYQPISSKLVDAKIKLAELMIDKQK